MRFSFVYKGLIVWLTPVMYVTLSKDWIWCDGDVVLSSNTNVERSLDYLQKK